MSNPVGEGRFSLILLGNELPAAEIENTLGIQPTSIVRKGDLLNKLPLMIAERDEWAHTISLTNSQDTDTALNDLLAKIILHAGSFKVLNRKRAAPGKRLSIFKNIRAVSFNHS